MSRNSQLIKAVALTALLLFLAVSLLSGVFIIVHAEHEHDHDVAGGCMTCIQLQNAGNLLRQIVTYTCGAASAVFLILAIPTLRPLVLLRAGFQTPVSLKSRMNQ